MHCELETAINRDENGNEVTIIKCHGELVLETVGKMKELINPLIRNGSRIILDLAAVKHLDSAGLGSLVGLKASVIKQERCILELANLTPGIVELLRITHLTHMFS